MDLDTVERSMFDVLVHSLPIDEVIHRTEIDLAVSSIDLAGAELAPEHDRARARPPGRTAARPQPLRLHPHRACSPSLGLLTINALTASDSVIVLRSASTLPLRGLVQLENTLTMIRENLNPTVEIRVILATMYDGRTPGIRRKPSRCSRRTSASLSSTHGSGDRALCGSARAGQLRAQVREPSGSAAQAYRELAKEVLDGATPRQHA